MNILISGASGLVGSALIPELEKRGHRIFKLVRRRAEEAHDVSWNVETGEVDGAKLTAGNTPDAMFHFAGESIASGRWTKERKRRIQDSRVSATELLVQDLLKLPKPPATFISASAVGYYGNRGDELLTEESAPGKDFLANVAIGWERAAQPLAAAGVRVVHARFGLILSASGGALPKMMVPFRFGVGGKLGDGCQWLSWIAIQDVVRLLLFLLEHPALSGPFNAVSPNPVQNAEWSKTVGRVLHRPAVVAAPAFALRLALGEMADALMLTSQRVKPQRVMEGGFSFEHARLEEALRAILQEEA